MAVAAASGNELLATLLYAISQGVHAVTMVEEYDTADTRQSVIRIHARVNAAIEAGDADLAESAMRQHISATNSRPLALDGIDVALSGENTVATPRAASKSRRSSK